MSNPDVRQVVSIRLSPTEYAALRSLSKAKKVSAGRLVSKWIGQSAQPSQGKLARSKS